MIKSYEESIEFLIEYIIYFFGIYVLTLILDLFGVFDKTVSYYAKRSFRNLSEAIHRSRFKRDYAKILMRDRYDRLMFTEKAYRCFRADKVRASDVNIEEIEEEWTKWKETKKIVPKDISDTTSRWFFWLPKKEKLSEYYFTELLNLHYLGTRAYRRNDRSEKLSIFGLFNLHFSKGFVSDFVFYIMNNHSFLSMFMAVRGHPFSRHARRLTYLSANCVTFFLTVFLLQNHPSSDGATVFSVFVISPVVIGVRKWMFSLLACPTYREILENQENNCLHCWYTCLSFFGKLFAHALVIGFVGILYVAAMITPKESPAEGWYIVLSYAHSVTLTSFGQEFIYALLVFWTGEACVDIKLCGMTVLGYGGYFRDKMHILGLRGLRLQQLKLMYMQEKLEKRLDREQRLREEGMEKGGASKIDCIVLEDDQFEEEESEAPTFSKSITTQDVPPSVLHRYDYAIQEIEWLRYLTCSIVRVEFYFSIPFVREFHRDLKDEYADMTDEEDNIEDIPSFELVSCIGNIDREDEEDGLGKGEKLLTSAVQKWNNLFEKKNSKKDTNSMISQDLTASTKNSHNNLAELLNETENGEKTEANAEVHIASPMHNDE